MSPHPTRLQGRTIVVTGAGSGIGAEIARRCLAEGAHIAAVDLDPAGLQALQSRAGNSSRLIVFQADVRDPKQPAVLLQRLAEGGRTVDGLAPCAGVTSGKTFLKSDPALWAHVLDINLMGVVHWTQACLAEMVQAGRGSVVLIGSQLVHGGSRGNACYVASKGAILALTRTLALEVADKGVRVNCLSPGATETPLLLNAMNARPDPEMAKAASRDRHAMRRFGRPEEVASAACFLLSDDGSFITGAELLADGGWSAA
jgi:2-keto-3-deoxy-L-fuconate dehydrogenase